MVAARIVVLLLPIAVAACSSQPVSRGKELYEANCANCHGLRLEGQPNWMVRLPSGRLPAPPHDESGHTWHHSDEQLIRITLDGLASIAPGYETDMPAFRDRLTEADVKAIFDYIKTNWSERTRNIQKARSTPN